MESVRTSDGFCINNLPSVESSPQNFQNPNDVSMITSSFNLNSLNYLSDNFCYGSSSDFNYHDFKTYEENASVGPLMFHGGILVSPEGKDSLMGSTSVLANNLGCQKDGKKRSRNSIQNVNNSDSCDKGAKKPRLARRQWTAEEDGILSQQVEEYGLKSWTRISSSLHGRDGKQCRDRWHNHLRPDIKKGELTEEEDLKLIDLHKQVGNRWTEVAKSLPGRTENSIKNHWYNEKEKYRKNPLEPSSTLSNYISSLPMENERNPRSGNIPPPSTSVNAPQNPGTGTCPADGALPDYKIDDILNFLFGDDSTPNLHTLDSTLPNHDAPIFSPETNYAPPFDVDELNDDQAISLWKF